MILKHKSLYNKELGFRSYNNLTLDIFSSKWVKLHTSEVTNVTITMATIKDTSVIGTVFTDCEFNAVLFDELTLRGCSFVNCRFIHCSFNLCNLLHCELPGTIFKDCMFTKSILMNFNIKDPVDCTMHGKPFNRHIVIYGLEYPVEILDNDIKVACDIRDKYSFASASDREALRPDGRKGLKFYKKYRSIILDLANS